MKSTAEHEFFMREALNEARLAYAEGEIPVGAVLVREETVILRAHNRTVYLHDPTAHAELLLLQAAARQNLGGFADCALYVTMEPCAMCAGAIANAKLKKLVFGAFDEKAGCCISRINLLDHALLYSTEVWSGVLEEDCKALLIDFFQRLR